MFLLLQFEKTLIGLVEAASLDDLRLADKQRFVPRSVEVYKDGYRFWRDPLAPTTVGEAIDDLPKLAAGEGKQETALDSQPTSEYQRVLRHDEARYSILLHPIIPLK